LPRRSAEGSKRPGSFCARFGVRWGSSFVCTIERRYQFVVAGGRIRTGMSSPRDRGLRLEIPPRLPFPPPRVAGVRQIPYQLGLFQRVAMPIELQRFGHARCWVPLTQHATKGKPSPKLRKVLHVGGSPKAHGRSPWPMIARGFSDAWADGR
jgi:hypothetical protein